MPKIDIRPNGESKASVIVSGAIDEDFDPAKINVAAYDEVEINLTDVSRMNSRGLRAWLRWTGSLERTKAYTLVGCPHIMVSIAGLVADLFPKWMKIESLEVPYVCESCGNTFSYMYKLQSQNTVPPDLPASLQCTKCKVPAEIGVSPEIYFRFLTSRK